VFRDNSGSGIQADLAPLNNLYLLRNRVYNNINGVILIDVTDAVIRDNIIRDNRDYGLATNSGVTSYVIAGNTITGNGVDVLLGSKNGTYDAGV
jgi:nitrous oxidase accessory protein NosD